MTAGGWRVSVLDDNINTFLGASYVLHRVAGLSAGAAWRFAASVDERGSVIVARFPDRDSAENLAANAADVIKDLFTRLAEPDAGRARRRAWRRAFPDVHERKQAVDDWMITLANAGWLLVDRDNDEVCWWALHHDPDHLATMWMQVIQSELVEAAVPELGVLSQTGTDAPTP